MDGRAKIFVAGVLIVLGIMFVRLFQKLRPAPSTPSTPSTPWGPTMRDMIDDPEGVEAQYRQQEQEQQQDRQPLDEAGMQAAAENLLNGQDSLRNLGRLQAQGGRAVPVLITCLADPRCVSNTALVPGLKQSPALLILDMLGNLEDARAVPAVLPLTKDSSQPVRAAAIGCLTRIGSEECVAPVTEAFASPDLRASVMLYLERELNPLLHPQRPNAETAGRTKQRKPLHAALFEPLLKLAESGDRENYFNCVNLLLQLDPEKAEARLLAPGRLAPENPNLGALLFAFNRARRPLPAQPLLDLLPELKRREAQAPADGHASAYGECLLALARTQPAEAERLAREALSLQSMDARRSAAEALCVCKGLEDPARTAYELIQKRGAANVPVSVREYAAVRSLLDEVSNGGLDQYFFNSAADEAASAQAGLAEMKLSAAAAAFGEASALFGPDGPSPDRRSRQAQLKSIVAKSERAFEKAERDFEKSDADAEIQTRVFAAEHAADFRGD